MQDDSEVRYWVPHKDLCWVPGIKRTCGEIVFIAGGVQRKDASGDVSFSTENGKVITVSADKAANLDVVEPDQLSGVNDICALRVVNEGALLHTIRARYLKDIIYTRVARIIVALNPFTTLPIYSSQVVDQYATVSDSTELPPHIFGIGRDALEGLRRHGRNQAILISGDSGAGKTESAKLIMAFVADAVRTNGPPHADGAEEAIEDRVLLTHSVIEAFGNAMTTRNNNSSRFGHWLDLHMSEEFGLVNCALTSYLLETMRVCKLAKNERSFHVFYQLLQASPKFPDLQLMGPNKYKYLNGGELRAPGIDDDRGFADLCAALTVLGFTQTQLSEIFRIVAGVLLLGNVDFIDSGGSSHCCQVSDMEVLQQAASTLGMNSEILAQCITVKKIFCQGEVTESPLRVDHARAARDSLARLLYGRLFVWIIDSLNETLYLHPKDEEEMPAPPTESAEEMERCLGILDLAGFESFERNSLEQLLINLSNEVLHHHFDNVILQGEIAEAEKEGIDAVKGINFTDNAEVLACISSKGGVLDLLDEATLAPGGTDAAFAAKVLRQYENCNHLVTKKFSSMMFGIHHFAGEVTYSCEGWLEKNADRPPDGAAELFTSAKLHVLQRCGQEMASLVRQEERKKTQGGRRKVKSVSATFRASLKSLMAKIDKSDPHYILCIKPNMEKLPKKFTDQNVMRQLMVTGVLAAVQVRQQGFAYRIPHEDFAYEYRCIVDAAGSNAAKASHEVVERIVKALPNVLRSIGDTSVAPDDFAVGHSKVFFKFSAYKPLQRGRQHALWNNATKIQSSFRGFMTRQQVGQWTTVRDAICDCLSPSGVGVDASSRRFATGVTRDSEKTWPQGYSILARFSSHPDTLEEQGAALLQQLELLLFQAQLLGFRNADVVQAESFCTRLQTEIDVAGEVCSALTSLDSVEIEKALSRANAVCFPLSEKLQSLEIRLKQVRTQLPLKRALEQALAEAPTVDDATDEQLASMQAILDSVDAAGLNATSGSVQDDVAEWLPELDAPTLVHSLHTVLVPIREKIKKRLPEIKIADEAPSSANDLAKSSPAPLFKSSASLNMLGTGRGKSRLTVPGFDMAEQLELIIGLKKAVDEYDTNVLESLLLKAAECGMDQGVIPEEVESDSGSQRSNGVVLAAARRVFRQLQSEDFIMQEVQRMCDETKTYSASSLRRLENLSIILGTMSGHEGDAQDVHRFLQETLLSYSKKKSNRKSVFDTEDPEELDLVTRFFGDLSMYYRLKPAKPWMSRLLQGVGQPATLRQSMARLSTKRSSTWRQSTWVGRELYSPKKIGKRHEWDKLEIPKTDRQEHGMMMHGKTIVESLTWPPAGYNEIDYDAAAVQNFRNVLVAMTDRPAQECQRVASRHAVISVCRCDPQLQDEVYLQLLKQMIKNPNPRSLGLGWELLYNLVQEVPPSEEIIEFVRGFITKGLEQLTEFSSVAYFYALRLARLLGCRESLNDSGRMRASKTV